MIQPSVARNPNSVHNMLHQWACSQCRLSNLPISHRTTNTHPTREHRLTSQALDNGEKTARLAQLRRQNQTKQRQDKQRNTLTQKRSSSEPLRPSQAVLNLKKRFVNQRREITKMTRKNDFRNWITCCEKINVVETNIYLILCSIILWKTAN